MSQNEARPWFIYIYIYNNLLGVKKGRSSFWDIPNMWLGSWVLKHYKQEPLQEFNRGFWGPNHKINCCVRLVATSWSNSLCISTICGSDSIDMEAPLKSSQPLTRVEELNDLLRKLFSIIKAKIPNRCIVFWSQNLVQNCFKKNPPTSAFFRLKSGFFRLTSA